MLDWINRKAVELAKWYVEKNQPGFIEVVKRQGYMLIDGKAFRQESVDHLLNQAKAEKAPMMHLYYFEDGSVGFKFYHCKPAKKIDEYTYFNDNYFAYVPGEE